MAHKSHERQRQTTPQEFLKRPGFGRKMHNGPDERERRDKERSDSIDGDTSGCIPITPGVDCDHSHDTTERSPSCHIGQIVRPANDPADSYGHRSGENEPSRSWEFGGQHGRDRECRRRMSGRERVPAAAADRSKLDVAGMHELGARAANDMFQNIGAQRGKAMRDETLPSGVFPELVLQSVPDCQQRNTDDDERLSFT